MGSSFVSDPIVKNTGGFQLHRRNRPLASRAQGHFAAPVNRKVVGFRLSTIN
jgi:hypothetical protein